MLELEVLAVVLLVVVVVDTFESTLALLTTVVCVAFDY